MVNEFQIGFRSIIRLIKLTERSSAPTLPMFIIKHDKKSCIKWSIQVHTSFISEAYRNFISAVEQVKLSSAQQAFEPLIQGTVTIPFNISFFATFYPFKETQSNSFGASMA